MLPTTTLQGRFGYFIHSSRLLLPSKPLVSGVFYCIYNKTKQSYFEGFSRYSLHRQSPLETWRERKMTQRYSLLPNPLCNECSYHSPLPWAFQWLSTFWFLCNWVSHCPLLWCASIIALRVLERTSSFSQLRKRCLLVWQGLQTSLLSVVKEIEQKQKGDERQGTRLKFGKVPFSTQDHSCVAVSEPVYFSDLYQMGWIRL